MGRREEAELRTRIKHCGNDELPLKTKTGHGQLLEALLSRFSIVRV